MGWRADSGETPHEVVDRIGGLLLAAARSRAMRGLESLERLIAASEDEPDARPVLDDVASSIRSMVALEHLTGEAGDALELNRHLERLIGLEAIRSNCIQLLSSSLDRVDATGRTVHIVSATLRELLHAAETTVPAGEAAAVHVNLRCDASELRIVVRWRCRHLLPVPTASGTAAIQTASRLASLSGGGMARRRTRNRMEIALTFRCSPAPPASGPDF